VFGRTDYSLITNRENGSISTPTFLSLIGYRDEHNHTFEGCKRCEYLVYAQWQEVRYSLSLAGLLPLPALLWRLTTIHFASLHAASTSWFAAIYLVAFTSIIGWSAWYGAIGQKGVSRIAPIQFAQPIVSLVIAVAIVGESITAPILLAIFAILTGLVITRKANG